MDESEADERLENIENDASDTTKVANATPQLISNFVTHLQYFIGHASLQEKIVALQKGSCAVFIKPSPGIVTTGNTWYLKWQYQNDGTISISVSHPC